MDVDLWILAAGLIALAIVHALWGLGASWPAPNREALALLVIGRRSMPGSAACLLVAAGLIGVAAATMLAPRAQPAGFVTAAFACIFLLRGLAGYAPALTAYARGTPFHRWNRIAYSPLCLGLGLWLGSAAFRAFQVSS